jgi:hypothetical protein
MTIKDRGEGTILLSVLVPKNVYVQDKEQPSCSWSRLRNDSLISRHQRWMVAKIAHRMDVAPSLFRTTIIMKSFTSYKNAITQRTITNHDHSRCGSRCRVFVPEESKQRHITDVQLTYFFNSADPLTLSSDHFIDPSYTQVFVSIDRGKADERGIVGGQSRLQDG